MNNALIKFGLSVVCLALPLSSVASGQDVRVSFSGDAQFSSADVPADGPALTAWRSSDQKWSRVVVLDGERPLFDWSFPEVLVKGVRWIEPGERFLTQSVGPAGEVDHLYSIREDGELELEWSSAGLERAGQGVTYTADGQYWISDRFGAEAATVSVGRVGQNEALWTWHLDAALLGEPGALELDEFSYTVSWGRNRGLPDVGILWGARLWLARPHSTHLVRVAPPAGCPDIYGVTATNDGLWVECYRGMDAKPSRSWAYYSDGFHERQAEVAPRLSRLFREPRFLRDGAVLDRDREQGEAAVHAVAEDGRSLSYLGSFELPAEARVVDAGGSLLVEVSASTDEFRVVPVQREVAKLRRSRASARN